MWMLTLRMAWRNLWRNTRRTVITAGAVGLGLAAMILTVGWMNGFVRNGLDAVIMSGYGDVQIHAPGWRQTRDAGMVIPDGAKVLERTRATPGVRAAAPRLYAIGLLAIGDRSANIEVIGIDTEAEREVTNWHRRLAAGAYPTHPRDAVIGYRLAEKLEVGVGSKLVLTVAEAVGGDMNSILLRVSGLAVTSHPKLDRRAALLPLETVRGLLGLAGPRGTAGDIHEIAITVVDPGKERADLAAVVAGLSAPGIEIATWQDLAPSVASIMDVQDVYIGITLVLIFVVIALGIVNTMSMALFERFREFGILKAMGTSPLRLAALILAEAASLGVVGCAMGLGLGLAVHGVLSRTGIDVGNMEAMGVTFETPIYTIVDTSEVVALTVIFLVLTPLVAIYPAIRAALIQPALALRHE